MKDYIKFSKNWNNKFCCSFFSTIRMSDPEYKKGQIYDIIDPRDNVIGKAKIVDVTTMGSNDLSNFETYLDAGLTVEAFKQLLCNIYNVDIEHKDGLHLSRLVLCWVHQLDSSGGDPE